MKNERLLRLWKLASVRLYWKWRTVVYKTKKLSKMLLKTMWQINKFTKLLYNFQHDINLQAEKATCSRSLERSSNSWTWCRHRGTDTNCDSESDCIYCSTFNSPCNLLNFILLKIIKVLWHFNLTLLVLYLIYLSVPYGP